MLKNRGRYVVMVTALIVAAVVATAGVARADKGWDYDSTLVQTTGSEGAGDLGDQFFHLAFDTVKNARGQSIVTGYVYNDYGIPADNVQVLIISTDASGRPVASTTRTVRGVVPALGRGYFEAEVPDGGRYEIHVVSFDFVVGPASN